MAFKFLKRKEKKSDIVQFQGGVYYLGTSNISQLKLKNYLQAYKMNDAIYACVNMIGRTASGIPWCLFRQSGDKIIEVQKHALVDFKNRPAKALSWPKFIERVFGYYFTSGNCYLRKLVGSFGMRAEIEFLRPDCVRIKTNALGISHYEYTYKGRITLIPPEEVLHFKTFNPEDELYGLSPVEAIARQVDIATLNQAWTISFLENEAMIGGKIKSKQSMTEAQKESIKEQIRTEHGGVLNMGKWLVLEGDMDAERFPAPMKELDSTPLERLILRKICAVFNIAPELMGDARAKTFSNVKMARKALYTETVLPVLDQFRDEFNIWIVQDFDPSKSLFLDYDTSDIEALSEDQKELWERINSAVDRGVITRNEGRKLLKHGKAKERGADKLMISATYVPLDMAAGEED